MKILPELWIHGQASLIYESDARMDVYVVRVERQAENKDKQSFKDDFHQERARRWGHGAWETLISTNIMVELKVNFSLGYFPLNKILIAQQECLSPSAMFSW